MRCPVCKDVDLVMSERSRVEIDYCPSCRGVWLDRGELDKIIERSTTTTNSRQSDYFGQKQDYRDDRRYESKRDYDNYHKGIIMK